MLPITAASAKPSVRKTARTASTASSAQATRRPPEVCGSVSSARSTSDGALPVDGLRASRPVPGRCAGDHARGGQLPHAGQERNLREVDRRAGGRRPADLEQMADEAESRDVGQRVHRGHRAERDARRVEPRRAREHGGVMRRRKLSALDRRAVHADAERLAENERVAFSRAGVALEMPGVDNPDGNEAIDRLHRVDRVASGDGNAGARAYRFAAVEDAADGVDRQLVDGHADERQREERRAAHCVDVGDRIGRRDHAEIVRIVDDRHEEIGRRDDRLPLVELVDRGVVGGFETDQQCFWHRTAAGAPQDLAKHRGRDLAPASAAVTERGEAKRGAVGSVHRFPRGDFGKMSQKPDADQSRRGGRA